MNSTSLEQRAAYLNAKSRRSAWCTKAELNGNVDSETARRLLEGHRYYIGLDVHKKTSSYGGKDASGQVQPEGKMGANRRELDSGLRTLPRPGRMALEATIFSGWIYDHRLARGEPVKVAHPVMLGAMAAAKKKKDGIDGNQIADCLGCDFLAQCPRAASEIRDRRRTLRDRHLRVRPRVPMKNRISGRLGETGVEYHPQRRPKVGYFRELRASQEEIPASIRSLMEAQ